MRRALRSPDRVALITSTGAVSYGELLRRALGVAARLLDGGLRPGEVVAVVTQKGVERVVGVLGILLAGGAYLPVDASQPAARRDLVLANAGAVGVLTQSWVSEATTWPKELVPLAVDRLPPAPAGTPLPQPRVAPHDLAYIIYTSGSAGSPKGVMIDHRGALNTVTDINARFGLGPEDKVIALASLGFDLSVWDIFGVLAVGGALVVPDAAAPATEASIWSIHFPVGQVDPAWSSIPYGRPLTNQTFHVLDTDLADCPEWVTGELYIGGVGVALGYQGDERRTAEHFTVDSRTGGRLYRTGDLGRFLPTGVIEFLGREDTQVKIHGHRIELAEVERALLADPAVSAAVVTVDGARARP